MPCSLSLPFLALQARLAAQKSDFDATLSHHLGFIDRLLGDKKALAAQVEALTKQLADATAAAAARLREAEAAAAEQLTKARDMWAAQEKVRGRATTAVDRRSRHRR